MPPALRTARVLFCMPGPQRWVQNQITSESTVSCRSWLPHDGGRIGRHPATVLGWAGRLRIGAVCSDPRPIPGNCHVAYKTWVRACHASAWIFSVTLFIIANPENNPNEHQLANGETNWGISPKGCTSQQQKGTNNRYTQQWWTSKLHAE